MTRGVRKKILGALRQRSTSDGFPANTKAILKADFSALQNAPRREGAGPGAPNARAPLDTGHPRSFASMPIDRRNCQ